MQYLSMMHENVKRDIRVLYVGYIVHLTGRYLPLKSLQNYKRVKRDLSSSM
jgi:hypothetical protein